MHVSFIRDSIHGNLVCDDGLAEILKGLKHNTTVTNFEYMNHIFR